MPSPQQKLNTIAGRISQLIVITKFSSRTWDRNDFFGNGGWTHVGYTDEKGTYRTFNVNIVDDDYIPAMKMELAAGRNFSDENTSDRRRALIVNEAFAKEYGWTDPIGKKIPGKGFVDHEIIGVVRDFNYASLYTQVPPWPWQWMPPFH